MAFSLYLDKVLPDRMGVRLPLWYPLLPSYWKPTKVVTFSTPLVNYPCEYTLGTQYSRVKYTVHKLWPVYATLLAV